MISVNNTSDIAYEGRVEYESLRAISQHHMTSHDFLSEWQNQFF